MTGDCETTRHPEGMLDRDQRTAKTRFFDGDDEDVAGVVCRRWTYGLRVCWRNYRNHLRKSMQRLKNVLFLSAYFVLLSFPHSLAFPTTKMEQSMYDNPCLASAPTSFKSESPRIQLEHAINQLGIALQHAENMRTRFKCDSYSINKQYDWLPKLPKEVDEPTPSSHLGVLEIRRHLAEIYRDLHKFAQAFEQVATESEQPCGLPYEELFGHIRSVMCEVFMVLEEGGIERTPEPKIQTEDLKDLDTSQRLFRNAVLFSGYLNMLQYTQDTLKHLDASEPSSDSSRQ